MNSKIAAVKQSIAAGRRREALIILRDLVKIEPENVHAWLYLAGLAPNAAARESCLKRAESINPDHPLVIKARSWAAPAASRAKVVVERVEQSDASAGPNESIAPVVEATPIVQNRPATRPTEPASTQLPAPAAAKSSRTVWIAGAAVVLLLAITAGALLSYTGWFGSLLETEPAFDTTLAENAADSEIADISAESLGESAASTPLPDNDPFINDSRRSSDSDEPEDGEIAGKAIVADNEVRDRWTATPSPTNTPSPTPTPTHTPTIPPTFVSEDVNVAVPISVKQNEKWIDVNLSTQTLNAYEGNKLVFSTLISSGLPQYPTVTGQFRVYLEYEMQTMDGRYLGYDYVVTDVPYVMYFYQGYAIHGAYWHNNFGNPMSHGCVNMEISEAQWIYTWASIGTLVNVHY